MAVLNLDGAHAKIARAGEHTEALDHEVRAWVESNPYSLSLDAVDYVDVQKTRYAVTVAGNVRRANTSRWALLFGDAIHNLRSALDHLFFAVAERFSPGFDVQRRVFPVFGQAMRFAVFKEDRAGFNIPAEVWAALEAEQPYRRQNGSSLSLLARLHQFDIRDKHHALAPFFVAHPQVTWLNLDKVGGEFEAGIIDFPAILSIESVNKDTEIASIVIIKPRPNVDPRFHLAFSISVTAERPSTHSDVPEVTRILRELSVEVLSVIERVSKAVT